MRESVNLQNQPPKQEIFYFAEQVSKQKEVFQQIQNKMSQENIMVKLALVS